MIKIFLLIFGIFFQSNSFANCSKGRDTSKIVVAGGSITEIIFFLDSFHKIVAVDTTSNFPEKAKNLPSIGYVRSLSVEGVLSLKPTIIIGENDMGPPNVINQLSKTSVELRILDEKTNAEGIRDQIDCVAKILDVDEQINKENLKELNKQIDQLKEMSLKNAGMKKNGLIILMMQGTSPIVAGRNTSGDSFLQMIGANNSMNTFDGWKPVGKESILQANPDFIIITKRGLKTFGSIDNFLKQSGIDLTSAAKNSYIYAEDGMSFLGFGPRTISTALKYSKTINEKSVTNR